MDSVSVRNLEQIQEDENGARPSRLGALLLASLAGAAIVTAGVVMAGRSGPPSKALSDPLSALVAQSKSQPAPAEELQGRDVSFPSILSDSDRPTTALAAVKDEHGRLVKQGEGELGASSQSGPPLASDRLPVVPLPIGDLLHETSVTSEPKDSLTALAADAARLPDDAALAAPGMEGGFQLQVASFKDQPDADKLVEDLRKRGHHAFRQAAYVPERGLWYRVRIGPFKSKLEASAYKEKFERSERITPYIVDPEKVKQAEAQRAQRAAVEYEHKKKDDRER
ncbi:MAG TPA: SPOR domain-containing protein [Polyangiaceae bacterium]|jgi:cell division septation protein DedD|nr:SPOR domain-containing protein [Polyangiaceae bacterium]